MYYKEFEIRWSDIDANRHLANSAYINFMSHTRMSFLIDHGMDQRMMAKYQIGPVVFFEHVYYFTESFQGQKIRVSFELGGMSKDGMFFRFLHNFYDTKGRNLAYCEMQGGWMDLQTRKLSTMPEALMSFWNEVPKAQEFVWLTKEDMRRGTVMPNDISF